MVHRLLCFTLRRKAAKKDAKRGWARQSNWRSLRSTMASEIATALIGLGGAMLGSAASSITALIIYRRERDKFARERLWESRREAYTRITASLAAIERFAAQIEYEWTDEAGGETYHGSRRYRAQAATLYSMRQDFERTYANNRIIISRDVARLIEGLLNDLEGIHAEPGLEPPDLSSEERKAYAKADREVLDAVKTELGVPN